MNDLKKLKERLQLEEQDAQRMVEYREGQLRDAKERLQQLVETIEKLEGCIANQCIHLVA
jgi:hypothetical protein